MNKSPQQAIFDACFLLCKNISSNTFDYLPESDTEYPFIHVGEYISNDVQNTDLIGTVTLLIGVWANRTQRKKADEIGIKIHDKALNLKEAYGYNTNLIDYSVNSITDTSTNAVLTHIVIEAKFMFTRKE